MYSSEQKFNLLTVSIKIYTTMHMSTSPLHQFSKFNNFLLVDTLKYLINEQGGYVVFLLLSEYSFIRDFRVERHGFSPKFFSRPEDTKIPL